MPKLARVQRWDPVRGEAAKPQQAFGLKHHYYAFLSYSHRDEATAQWLHEALERFRVPPALVARLTDNGAIPRRLTPIFRDRGELPAADDLGAEIRQALGASRFLIVLCSPAAAQSRWTNAEIEAFKKVRPEGCVLAAIISGEPFASDVPGREEEECLPPALRYKYDRRGRRTERRAEPLAADLRGDRDGKRMGLLKIIAGMLGVGLDELVQRETLRRQKRLALLAAASLAGMAVTTTLAFVAIEARDAARDQRREAEGLVGFMLGDLRSKLEPLGRLDVLDSVGTQALDYYEKQDESALSDDGLAQRSRALTLMGEIANTRGNLDAALRLYSEALAGTAEALRRDPANPQRMYDHAQNVFWVGQIALERGDPRKTEAAWREYKRLADLMAATEPGNAKWRMEVKYADSNLGIVALDGRRFGEASRLFQESLNTIESLAAAEPANTDYQKSLAESLAWLADAQLAEGRLDEAIAQRERQLALLNRLMGSGRSDVEYRQKAIPAYQALGRLFAQRGENLLAMKHLRAAVSHAEALIPVEPENAKWLDAAASARLALAQLLLAGRNREEASMQARAGCALVNRLVARDATVVPWRESMGDCLAIRARLALDSGSTGEAIALAERALANARAAKGNDPIADRYELAASYRLLGDARVRAGNPAGARAAWRSGLEALPNGVAERPAEMGERSKLLHRIGRASEARQLSAKLDAIGYHATS